MRTLAITGATGFVGAHLVRRLLRREDFAIRALVHQTGDDVLPRSPQLQWIRGDLADEGSLKPLLRAGCDLVDLAYPARWPHDRHLATTAALARAALDAGVRRVVHCSTAVVVGRSSARHVTESTTPRPASAYEHSKLAIEQAWLECCRGRAEIAVLRPTAVYGPHGRNLLKLAQDLTLGNGFLNYLRSSLYRRRRMNLVHVSNVAAAIEFLLDLEQSQANQIYIVSDDEDPGNNFDDVEKSLRRLWRMPYYPVSPLPVPQAVLSALLRVMGRSNDPGRIYDAAKLRQAGFRRICGLDDGLREFAAWYESRLRNAVT